MSSVTNIVAGRLGLAAAANLAGRPVASQAERLVASGAERLVASGAERLVASGAERLVASGAERRAPSSYGLTRLGIVPADDDDPAPRPMAPARPAMPETPAEAAACDSPREDGPGSPCDTDVPPARQDAGQTPAPQAEACTACSFTSPGEPGTPATPAGPATMDAQSQPQPQAQAQPPADEDAKRRTFRLPGRLANRMKAYATTTGQYQYVVATEALRQFLDGAVPALDFASRARLAEIQSRLETPSPITQDASQ